MKQFLDPRINFTSFLHLFKAFSFYPYITILLYISFFSAIFKGMLLINMPINYDVSEKSVPTLFPTLLLIMYIHIHLVLVDYKFINGNTQEYVFSPHLLESFEHSKHLISMYWVFFWSTVSCSLLGRGTQWLNLCVEFSAPHPPLHKRAYVCSVKFAGIHFEK